MKFFPHGIGRDRQAVTYNTVKDHIVQCIQKTYKNGQDAAVSIRKLSVIDLTPQEPNRGRATRADAAEKLEQQAGMDIMHQAGLERYLDRKDTLEQNLTKAYALIFSTYCNGQHEGVVERVGALCQGEAARRQPILGYHVGLARYGKKPSDISTLMSCTGPWSGFASTIIWRILWRALPNCIAS
jgi:hypothetical protein